MSAVREIHAKKNNYNIETTQTINKQIEAIQRRITRTYEDKVDGIISEDFWRFQNQIWHAQKDDLYRQLRKINEFDEHFYNEAETLLNWCKDSYNAFLKGTQEDKRFIAQILVSNFSYEDKKLSVEPYSVFYNMLDFAENKAVKKATVELAETQQGQQKTALEKAVFF